MLIPGCREPVDEAGEEVHATFFVYFADAVLLQHLIDRCTLFIDQVVGRDMFRVQCDSLRQIMFPALTSSTDCPEKQQNAGNMI